LAQQTHPQAARPVLSNTNLVLNELIREYLEFNNYKHTQSVFIPETGQPEEAFDR
jgi:lisH domain-containing protein FOPNL